MNVLKLMMICAMGITAFSYAMDTERKEKLHEERVNVRLKIATESLQELEKDAKNLHKILYEERRKKEEERNRLHARGLEKNSAKL